MPRRRTSRRRPLALAAAAALAILALAAGAVTLLWATLPDPAPLARETPRTTAIVEQRRAEARRARRPFRPAQAWVGLDRISPWLVEAVVLSEDAKFFGHEGFDWEAIRVAAEADLRERRFARGASTLTQQLAKNLWLGTEKTLLRKAKEAVLAAKLERALSKRRILALYLNVVELGDGVFGAEAGARARFGTSAAALTPAQAAVLASMLPAPRKVDLARPSTWLQRRARRVLDRLRDTGRLSPAAHLSAAAELERILAGPRPLDDRGDEEPPEDDAVAIERATKEGVSAAEVSSATAATATADPSVRPGGSAVDEAARSRGATETAASPLVPSAATSEAERSRGAPGEPRHPED